MRSYQFPYMSNFDDYQYPTLAYATTTGCFKNAKGEQVYTGPGGRKGYSPVSCDAAKKAFYKVHGSAEFADLTANLEAAKTRAKARDPGENPASGCGNCNQDWSTNPLGTLSCEIGKISCEAGSAGGDFGGMLGMGMMPIMIALVGIVVLVMVLK